MKTIRITIGLLLTLAILGCRQPNAPEQPKPQVVAPKKVDAPPVETVASLGARLRQGSLQDKQDAAIRLAGRGSEAASVLGEALTDGDWKVRFAAANALNRLGADAKPAVHAMTTALKEWVPQLQLAGRFGIISRTKVTFTTWSVPGDEDVCACQEVVVALGKIGPYAAAAVPELTEFVKADYAIIGLDAIKTLEKMGEPGLPALIMLYGRTVREESTLVPAFELEQQFAKHGSAVTPHLVKAIAEHSNGVVRGLLVRLLPHADGTIPVLIDLLEDKDRVVRSDAAERLGGYTKNARLIVPVLVAALKKEQQRDAKELATDPELKTPRVGPQIQDPPMKQPREVDDVIPIGRAVSLRELLIVALGRFGMEGKDAEPLLETALNDADANVRVAAMWAKKRIEPAAK